MAYRAYLGCFLADVQVTAVAANPYGVAFAREYYALFDVLKQTTITLLVVLFDGCDSAETMRDVGEPFCIGLFSHLGIHVGPLLVLAFGCGTEIVHRV